MRKKYIIMVTTALLLQSLFVSMAYASPDYDMLIITPEEFADELEPLKQFKDATSRPSVIVTLEDIYSDYTGADQAEKIKKCIADYEDTHNIKYVLLVGDVDKLPMRYFYLKREVTDEVRWLQYYLTDHYYADLYDSSGDFCSWDADGDGIFGEIIDDDDDGDYSNTDGIDYDFDVVVGRIPVDSEDEVEIYVDKVIDYETEVVFDSWFKNILLVTGTGDWVYPELPTTYDEDQNDLIDTEMSTIGFSSVKLYHSNTPGDPDYPNPTNINNNLNSGMGFMNVISHGCETSWGVYDVTTDMSGLTNQDRLTVVYSFGCSTGKIGPIAAANPYIDVDGIYRDYGTDYDSSYYPHPKSTWIEPAVPDALQDSTTDVHGMPEYWNFDSNTGAVAFVGSTAETSGVMGSPVMQYFYQSFASDGYRVLGDVWNSVCDKVLSGGHSIGSDWDHARRWLYINVFGDPTLALGGLSDKPPETSLSIGSPIHIDGATTYVTGTTPFTLTATDDFGIDTTYYLYYPLSSPHSTWSTGTSFTMSGGDGLYIIWYYSLDTGGNIDYPLGSKLVMLDNSAPTTTLSIGLPMYASGADTYINSDTYITLSPTDTSSGVDYSEYSINGGGWITYGTPFRIYGADGLYTISYRSVDNLGNVETTQEQDVILDNTAPEITLTIGSPQYGTTPLWVTSGTPFTISLTDSGSGVDYSQYSLDGDPNITYAIPFTIPGDENDNARNVDIGIQAFDMLGNMNSDSKSVILDNKPPASMLSIGEPNYYDYETVYITSATELSFDPMDWEDYGGGVGVDFTTYRIDGGTWEDYTIPFVITGSDGIHTLEYYSVDYLGNTEVTEPYEFFIDNTPPEVNVEQPLDGDYVYGSITIEISATDEGSGVNNVEYSLDDGATWLPAVYDSVTGRWLGTWDTTIFSEGSHTILARAGDNVENVGYDETPPTVNIIYLDYETSFSDSNWNAIEDFNVNFNEQKPGIYKISTNPGTMYEIITITNTGTLVTLPEVILDVMVPIEADFLGSGEEAFEFQGAKSVHVYLNEEDVTPLGKWLPDLSYVDVMQALAPGDTIEIYLHYEYSFKGEKYTDPDVSSWLGEDYTFETDILSAFGPTWSDYLSAIPVINEL